MLLLTFPDNPANILLLIPMQGSGKFIHVFKISCRLTLQNTGHINRVLECFLPGCTKLWFTDEIFCQILKGVVFSKIFILLVQLQGRKVSHWKQFEI